jgi:hypothetical protein
MEKLGVSITVDKDSLTIEKLKKAILSVLEIPR